MQQQQNCSPKLNNKSNSENNLKSYEVKEEDIKVELKDENKIIKNKPQPMKNIKVNSKQVSNLRGNNIISYVNSPIREVVEEEETSKHETPSHSMPIHQKEFTYNSNSVSDILHDNANPDNIITSTK